MRAGLGFDDGVAVDRAAEFVEYFAGEARLQAGFEGDGGFGDDRIFECSIDQSVEEFSVRTLSLSVIEAEFMGRCSELRSLVGRQLQVADRAVEQGDVRVCVYPSGEFGEVGNVEASCTDLRG